MSSRPSSSRGSRLDKDSYNDDYRNEGSRRDKTKPGKGPRHSRDDRSPANPRKGRYDNSGSSSGRGSSKYKDKYEDGGRGTRRSDRGGGGRGGKSERRAHDNDQSYDRDDTRSDRKTIESKVYQPAQNESKLAKLLRRIREDDRDRRIGPVRQLLDYIHIQENYKQVSRSCDLIQTQLYELFTEKTYMDIKEEAAKCMGSLGCVLGEDAYRLVKWLLGKLKAVGTSENVKVLLLHALHTMLELDRPHGSLHKDIHIMMTTCQYVLEEAVSSDLLIAVVTVIKDIAGDYPHVFDSQFKDTVDILVGWLIESSQKEHVIKFTSAALVDLQPFWSTNLGFSLILLGHFLEDLEAYVEDLGLVLSGEEPRKNEPQGEEDVPEKEDLPETEECIAKIAALLGVFTTVIQSVGDHFKPGHYVDLTPEYILDTVVRIISCIQTSKANLYCEKVLTKGNHCVAALLLGMGQEQAASCPCVIEFVCEQAVAQEELLSTAYITSLLTLNHKFIKVLGGELPHVFITSMLASNSILHSARFSTDRHVYAAALSVYRSILTLKKLDVIVEAYRFIVGDLETSLHCLLKHMSWEGEPVKLLSDTQANPMTSGYSDITQAQTSFIFDVSVLAEMGNARNNFIGMLGLQPTIFELLSEKMRVLHEANVMAHWPAEHYAVLLALFSHSHRHGHFVAVSALMSSSSPLSPMGDYTIKQSTQHHLASILQLLTRMLRHAPSPAYDSRYLALRWTHALLKEMADHQCDALFSHVLLLDLVGALLALGYNSESSACVQVAACLQAYLQNTSTYCPSILTRCREVCSVRLSDSSVKVREAYAQLLTLIPISVTTRYHEGVAQSHLHKDRGVGLSARQQAGGGGGPEAFWLARRHHMTRSPTTTFHSHNFRAIMSHILQPWNHAKLGPDWLERIFHSCQRANKETNGDVQTLATLVENNTAVQWFWALWECAQFCILAKLRTPLGKAQETFTSIEAALKTYVNTLKKRTLYADKPTLLHNNNKGENGRVEEELLRVHLLLQFMQHLEKQLYNAYEGSAIAMPQPPKAVRTFFRTNRSTCVEWLLRVRLLQIQIAEAAGQHATVIHHAYLLLQDMYATSKHQVPEFERTVRHAITALCHLRCPEAILGLHAWCRNITGKKLKWIKAAAERASARYENAITEYKAALKQPQKQEGASSDEKEEEEAEEATQAKTNPELASFLSNQVCEMYGELGSWEEAMAWQKEQEQAGVTMDTQHMAYISALSKFELGEGSGEMDNDVEVESWLPWCSRDVVEVAETRLIKAVTLGNSSAAEMSRSGHRKHTTAIEKLVKEAESWCNTVLSCGVLEWPPGHLNRDALIQLYSARVCANQLTLAEAKWWPLPLLGDISLDPQEHDVGVCLAALRLLHLQDNLQRQHGHQSMQFDVAGQLWSLKLATIRLCRKQGNVAVCERLLLEELPSVLSTDGGSVVDAVATLHQTMTDGTKIIRLEREVAKLVYARGDQRLAMESLSSSIVNQAHTISNMTLAHSHSLADIEVHRNANARSLLSLVNWLQHDPKYLSHVTSQLDGSQSGKLIHNLSILLALQEQQAQLDTLAGLVINSSNNIVTNTDVVLGGLLRLSVQQCPGLAKAWLTMAGCCYRWGRRSVDNTSSAGGMVTLSEDERTAVCTLIPHGTPPTEIDAVLEILSRVHSRDGSTAAAEENAEEDDIIDADQGLYDDGTETTRRQLLSVCMALQIASDDCIERLLAVWKGLVQRVYHYYQYSAKAYFTYLNLTGQAGESGDGTITSTLRLLRLLVKHAWELRETLEDGFAETPTAPWKGIIPQLFSRLSHPEAYVRQSVSELLGRVGHDAPHLIVFPAVVGVTASASQASQGSHATPGTSTRHPDALINRYLSQGGGGGQGHEEEEMDVVEEEEEDREKEAKETMLKNCFAGIVDKLGKTNPRLVNDVEVVVTELRRMTQLWDELWLSVLTQHQHEIGRRLGHLDTEIRKVHANPALSRHEKEMIIRKKHSTVLKPSVFLMEQLHEATTSHAPQTPHERWFVDTYGSVIERALDKLRQPLTDFSVPPATSPSTGSSSSVAGSSGGHHQHSGSAVAWSGFRQLQHSLAARAAKRSALVLAVSEMSPALSNLSGTVLPMPGVDGDVTVSSVHNTVHVLPTKTKPKKLMFIGSDGKKYPYLFKGVEDLHLDERIMQFLAIVNNMFSKANKGERKLYHARHYSVTPLGTRSGLIQWVDGATPLFSLYKRWQQREALALVQKSQAQQKPTAKGAAAASATQASTSTSNLVIPRPSEVYYSKLTPILQQHGISNPQPDSRRDWPVVAMKKALVELINETPGDLLAKELWCVSGSAAEWWQVTQTYSRSTAVMSVIGYIIGLGDRHLDNLLVDLRTGQVVHIDYNVCFEKGRGLRVPEKVPFRMTQNIVGALGVTGMEGVFRSTCEYVVRTLRRGKETLLTLLEAFVYDPLVDWTTGGDGGGGGGAAALQAWLSSGKTAQRKQMDVEIARSMFAIRMLEMKSAWISNRKELLSGVKEMGAGIEAAVVVEEKLAGAQRQLDGLQQQRAYLDDVSGALEEEEEDNTHRSLSLPERFQQYSLMSSARKNSLVVIQQRLTEAKRWHKQHKYAFEVMKGGRIQQMRAELAQSPRVQGCFTAILEFLQGAGQGQLAQQCQQVCEELDAELEQRRQLLKTAIDMISSYADIVSHFPVSYLEDSQDKHHSEWLESLRNNLTARRCGEICEEFKELQEERESEDDSIVADKNRVHARLKTIVNNTNAKLMKYVERRSQESYETAVLTQRSKQAVEQVHSFIQEHRESGLMCMTSVMVSALCSLNRRNLIMEAAAAAAGDRLVDLTSRDGDWFLDELHSMSGNINHVLDVLTTPQQVPSVLSAEASGAVMSAVASTHAVYTALLDLRNRVHAVILPEARRHLQAASPSVLAAITALKAIETNSGTNLDQLVTQLETQLLNVIMGIEADEKLLSEASKLRSQYQQLLSEGAGGQAGWEGSHGYLLLMAFDGLFSRLDADLRHMADLFSHLLSQSPLNWKKVDIIKEARSLQMNPLTESSQRVMSHLMFVKQLRAMLSFFQLVQDTAKKLAGEHVEGSSGGICMDDDQLCKPIRRFIADYFRKNVLGVPSQTVGYVLCRYISQLHVNINTEVELRDIGAECKVSLEDLCKKAVDMGLKRRPSFSHSQLSDASTLIGTVDTTWRKSDFAQRLGTHIEMIKDSLQRSQKQVERYEWLQEELIIETNARTTLTEQLSKLVGRLASAVSGVSGVNERHLQLEASVNQRLKWAAGANPNLAVLVSTFEESLRAKNTTVKVESELCGEVGALCQVLQHFEQHKMRGTEEGALQDGAFKELVAMCRDSCQIIEAQATDVTEVEEALITTTPTNVVTEEWVQQALRGVDKASTVAGRQLAELRSQADTAQASASSQVSSLRSALTQHHSLMVDVRSVLRSLAKYEEQEESGEHRFRDYMDLYKEFSEQLTSLLRLCSTDPSPTFTPDLQAKVSANVSTLQAQIPRVYGELMALAPPLESDTDGAGGGSKERKSQMANFATVLKRGEPVPVAVLESLPAATPPPQPPPTPQKKAPEKITRDPKTGKAIQERNSYAVSVWRRVKMKLDGRDPDQNKRIPVTEQVENMLSEAVDMENLALLYEGWTPWV